MTDRKTGELLWELPAAETADDGPAPSDGELTAYRAGILPPVETTRVEWGLAGSRSGRARLATLAGIRLEEPGRSRFPRYLAAAALAVAAMLTVAALLVLERGRTPVLPAFDVRVEGLASQRAEPGGAKALAEGTVRVFVEPREGAVSGVHFAAYRLEGNALTRLSPGEVSIEIERGSAVLTAPARSLVGSGIGTREFFVVVSGRGDLPRRIEVERGDPAGSLGRAADGRGYRVPLTIVNAEEDAP